MPTSNTQLISELSAAILIVQRNFAKDVRDGRMTKEQATTRVDRLKEIIPRLRQADYRSQSVASSGTFCPR